MEDLGKLFKYFTQFSNLFIKHLSIISSAGKSAAFGFATKIRKISVVNIIYFLSMCSGRRRTCFVVLGAAQNLLTKPVFFRENRFSDNP